MTHPTYNTQHALTYMPARTHVHSTRHTSQTHALTSHTLTYASYPHSTRAPMPTHMQSNIHQIDTQHTHHTLLYTDAHTHTLTPAPHRYSCPSLYFPRLLCLTVCPAASSSPAPAFPHPKSAREIICVNQELGELSCAVPTSRSVGGV